MKKDIEIAREFKLRSINEIGRLINLTEEDIEPYGRYKGKINKNYYDYDNEDGRLVLVSAINPTPLGEGKTTVTIGLCDSLRYLGENSILCLRQPSLGPVFGMKGGATGGGYSQIAPIDEINIHFTGDIHAIESANNLLMATIDNHIYHGNDLNIDPSRILVKRCMDMNDRQLRRVITGLSDSKVIEDTGFEISVASEVMAVFCLADSLDDLRNRLNNMLVAYNRDGEMIFAKDLKVVEAMLALLYISFKPNLVQTLYGSPAIVHGGPFANIAHGCNSLMATKLGLKLADFTITEAGFGADLGLEKFMDIKVRQLGKAPDVVVLVATIRALKYNAYVNMSDINDENIDAVKSGSANLIKHINNVRDVYGLKLVVAINKFYTDTDEEIRTLENILDEINVEHAVITAYNDGETGGVELANKVIKLSDSNNGAKSPIKYAYDLDDTIENKIEKLATKVYGANDIIISKKAKNKIDLIKNTKYDKIPICIAKTQYSLSDNSKLLGCPKNFDLHIDDISIRGGAEFIVCYTTSILTMPGLPKKPRLEGFKIDEKGIYADF